MSSPSESGAFSRGGQHAGVSSAPLGADRVSHTAARAPPTSSPVCGRWWRWAGWSGRRTPATKHNDKWGARLKLLSGARARCRNRAAECSMRQWLDRSEAGMHPPSTPPAPPTPRRPWDERWGTATAPCRGQVGQCQVNQARLRAGPGESGEVVGRAGQSACSSISSIPLLCRFNHLTTCQRDAIP